MVPLADGENTGKEDLEGKGGKGDEEDGRKQQRFMVVLHLADFVFIS
jgi:hypothetical protein